nr:Hpt domain-containing protein [Bacteriovorax sp.]
MNLTDAEKNEFLIESTELLEDAEKGLLNIDRGAPFLDNYNSIFRAFHSLKGASGMIGLMDLSNHLHKIETLFTEQKTKSEISKAHVDFFLRAIDASRELLDGNTIEFDYTINENKTETQTITITRDHITENKPIAKAMVVDDETDLLEEIAELLKDNLIESLCFTNAKDALAKITEYQPDVILSDITMPSMNGGEFLKEL